MPRTRWPARRLAQAAFLAGRGQPADRIAAHPLVSSVPHTVVRYLEMVGLVTKTFAREEAIVAVPAETVAGLRAAARARRETPESLAARALAILAAEPALLDNVLDDG